MTPSPKILFASLIASQGVQGAFYYPNAQNSLLEHILVDNWGAYASNFSSAITPCTNYVSQSGEIGLNSGRTTAAQWMRVAFHDFITYNATEGSGGLDASIGFETLRAENKGSAMNDSFAFWRPFVNDQVSMADLVALGTVMAMNHCGSRKVPYRPGRVDATSAGLTTGVPAPETDLEETLAFFERAGFGKADAIGLTACGHTMGSVHHGGFPEAVPESFVTPNNTNGGFNFDSTRGVFDELVVHEYIDWTGNQGGPLVTSFNESSRSDLRLYESDANATMRKLYDQGPGFVDTCVDLMGRMINTVPHHAQLQDPIRAMAIKPINVTYDFNDEGELELSGIIRVLTSTDESAPKHLTFEAGACRTQLSKTLGFGSSVFGGNPGTSPPTYGTTTYFPFRFLASTIGSPDSFSISAQEMGPEHFAIQSDVFVVPSMTTQLGSIVNVTIAGAPGFSWETVAIIIAAPVSQSGTLAPKVIEKQMDLNRAPDSVAGYELWEGTVDIGQQATGLVTIKVSANGTLADIFFLNAGMAGW